MRLLPVAASLWRSQSEMDKHVPRRSICRTRTCYTQILVVVKSRWLGEAVEADKPVFEVGLES